MNDFKKFPGVEVAVMFFAGWQARDLLNAWQHSPHDHFGWLVLGVWLLPLVVRLCIRPQAIFSANPFMLGAAIIAGFLGALTELHFFGQVAFALAFAAWFNLSWHVLFWLTTALAWMPVFGWWLADFSGATVLILRLLLAIAGIIGLGTKAWLTCET